MRPRRGIRLLGRGGLTGAWLLALTLGAVGCSDWAGARQVEFEDPYIQRLEPDHHDGWLGRIRLYRQYAAMDKAFRLENQGRHEEAAAEVANYLGDHPDDVQVRAYYLSLLTRLDRPEEVEAQATRILDTVPDFVPALLARGRARAVLGRPGPAIEDLLAASRASGVLPEDRTAALEAAARLTLANAARLEEAGRLDEAEGQYAAALELPLTADQRARAVHGRTRTAAALALADQDYERAARELESLLRLGVTGEERQRTLDRLATALERDGRPAEAAVRVEELMADAGASVSLHRRAAALYRSAGRLPKAAAHLEAAGRLARGAERARLLHQAAGLYARAGWGSEAMAALRAAVDADPGNASLNAELGRALVDAGQPADALQPLQRAMADTARGLSDAELTESRLAFARAYEQAGRLDAAMDLYESIADGEPPGSPARIRALERLAQLHARRGDHLEAADRMMELSREPGAGGSWALEAGDQYAAVGAWPEAVAAYRAAMAAGSLSGVEGFRKLGVALYEAGDRDEAAGVLGTIPAAERNGQDLRYLAALAQESGDTARAIALHREALPLVSGAADSAAIYRSIGYLQVQRDDSAAVVALSRALALEPDEGVRLDLARAQLRLGQPDAALRTVEAGAAEPSDRALQRLDLLAEIQAERGDTAGVVAALRDAAEQEPSADRLTRLAFFYEATGDDEGAAQAFRRAYEAEPGALAAARVAYAYRRLGDDLQATTWFRRSIDHAAEGPDTGGVDVQAAKREVALLTDRLSIAAYASYRSGDESAVPLPGGGVAQAGVASQGGLEVAVRPLVQRVSWGRDVDVFGRVFWGFEDGLRVDGESWQGQLGVRYRPRYLPGTALGLERWIGLGSAARDLWAARVQAGRLLGRPYPEPGDGVSAYASLYGDAAYLFDADGTYTLYGEARPGVAIPLGRVATLLPHGTASAYHQSPGGIGQSYVEAGPGLGLRLRFPRESRYARDYWSLQLMAQYRWGAFPDAWDAGGESYDELVLTFVLQL